MSQETDQPLIMLVLDGDMQAFAKLASKYQHMIYNLALKLVGNAEEAEELTQDTFLKVYEALPNFKGESKFSTWLYRIAYNKSLDLLKKRKRKLEVHSIDSYPNLDIPSLENHWDALEFEERRVIIKNAVEELEGADVALITLFYFEELSLSEIAEILSIKENAAKVKLFRARKRLAVLLRKKLEPEIIEGYESKR